MSLKAHYHPECVQFAEFQGVKNCHLGNNRQSEYCIQQMNHSKTKGQACKDTWVDMGLYISS